MFQKKKMNCQRMKISDIWNLENISDDNTIFELLADATAYPLVHDFITANNYETLDIDYLIGYSADKFVSPLTDKLYNKYNNVDDLTSDLANIIYNRFAVKWKKIYDALMTEYNPLENYNMEEERTPDLTFEDTENVNSEITTNRETSASNNYKGFNADTPVLVNETSGTDDSTTAGASEDNETHKVSTHTGTETLTRSGNIGVTTSQAMLQAELEVRKNDFYKMMYNDIDSLLCLSIY